MKQILARPNVSQGLKIGGKKQVVPNQALSLAEIIERFSRNEVLPIGRETSYDDGDDDLEKVAQSDLVDRAEFSKKMEDIKTKYEAQEKRKKAAQAKKLAEEAKEQAKKELAAEAAKKAENNENNKTV